MGIRTYVYVDGFNFYYGAVKGTRYKWLDFKALFGHILNNDRGHHSPQEPPLERACQARHVCP